MITAWFRFYEELNDFLPPSRKKLSFSVCFRGNTPVKDIIESLGVPHTEIDLILVNGLSVDFKYRLKDDDKVSVYPVFETLDISEIAHLRPKPLRITRFICDAHLGKLARYLRLAGFDTDFDTDYDDMRIAANSVNQKRIILTRDRGLLKNRMISHGYWIRSSNPREQFLEVINRFDLRKSFQPFTRCLECNKSLVKVTKDEISARLMPRTREYYSLFKKCPACERIFWEGSHYESMKNYIRNLLIPDA